MIYLLAVLALTAVPANAKWSFEDDPIGKPPRGFYFDTTRDRPDAKWRVIEDGQRRVLAQLDDDRDRRRLALAVAKEIDLKDVRVSCQIKIVAGEAEQAAGMVWRYKDSENYLVARLDTAEKNVRLYRVVDGHRVKFGGADRNKLEANRWYQLRIEHRGVLVKVYLDDEMLFDERDRHFTKAGKAGLWTKGDTIAYFDDLRIEELDDD